MPQAVDIGARARERCRMDVEGAGPSAMVMEKDVVGPSAMVVESNSIGPSFMVTEVGDMVTSHLITVLLLSFLHQLLVHDCA